MSIPVKFEEITEQFDFRFSEEGESFDPEFQDLYLAAGAYRESYGGPYTVIPTPSGQVLGTRDKVMESDLQIQAIPFSCVSNTAGGETVYIGSEI